METVQQQLDSLNSSLLTFCLYNWKVEFDQAINHGRGGFAFVKRLHRRGGNRKTFDKNVTFWVGGNYAEANAFIYGLYLGTPRTRTRTRKVCPDCGEFDKSKGHMDCQFPND